MDLTRRDRRQTERSQSVDQVGMVAGVGLFGRRLPDRPARSSQRSALVVEKNGTTVDTTIATTVFEAQSLHVLIEKRATCRQVVHRSGEHALLDQLIEAAP
jgi:hypothetical protein